MRTIARGVRRTEVPELADELYLLVVRLLDARGASTAMRRTLVTLRGTLGVVVVIARP